MNKLNEKIKDISKKLVEQVIDEVFELINLYIKTTPNKYDDLLLSFVPQAKSFIVEKIINN